MGLKAPVVYLGDEGKAPGVGNSEVEIVVSVVCRWKGGNGAGKTLVRR